MSGVPLASNTKKKETKNEEKKVQFEDPLHPEKKLNKPGPGRKPKQQSTPPPTINNNNNNNFSQTELEFNTGIELAKSYAEQIQKPITDTQAKTAVKKIKKAIDENEKTDDMEKKRADLIALLINYRQVYTGRIGHNFNSDAYYYKASYSALAAEVKIVRTLINCKDVPTILKTLCSKLCEIVEIASIVAGPEHHNLMGFTNDVDQNIKAGHFTPEFEQIAVEFADYFNVGPLKRLGGKLALIGSRRYGLNTGRLKEDFTLDNTQMKKSPANYDL